ncbi:serine-rich adhesin for platelets isoform X2 [Halyomorpha halys]
MSGFEDQQIKKIEDLLDSKVLGNLGSAQLIDENFFHFNQDSNFNVHHTTKVRKINIPKKRKMSSKALQGLYRQVFSHIPLPDSTHDLRETPTSSLLHYFESSATRQFMRIKISTKSLDDHSESLTPQPVTNEETSSRRLHNRSTTSITQPVLDEEISTICLDYQCDSSTMEPESVIETSTSGSEYQYDSSTMEPVSVTETTTSLDSDSEDSVTEHTFGKETSKPSLNRHSRASTRQHDLGKETSTIVIDNHLYTSTTEHFSDKETSTTSSESHLHASTKQHASHNETWMTSLKYHSNISTTQHISDEEISTTFLDNHSYASAMQHVSHKETRTTSLKHHSNYSTTQLISDEATSTTGLDNYSEAPATQHVSDKETSMTSLDNHSEASATQHVSDIEGFKISLDNNSYDSTTQHVLDKETHSVSDQSSVNDHSNPSTIQPNSTILENHSESSTILQLSNNEASTNFEILSEATTTPPDSNKDQYLGLPQLFGSHKVIPIHNLNESHICIDIGDICNDNETKEHIRKHSEENPDLRAKTDTTLSTPTVATTTVSTTRRSFYPGLTLLKPPFLIIEKPTAQPVTALAHMEFIGQITCHWVCDSKNVSNEANETLNQIILSSSISNRKRESLFPSSTSQPSDKVMVIPSTMAATATNKLTTQHTGDLYAVADEEVCPERQDFTVENVQNSTCSDDDSHETNFMPEGVTMTCAYSELTVAPETCSDLSPITETCATTETEDIVDAPENVNELTTVEPDISDLPEVLIDDTSEPPENLNISSTTAATTKKSRLIDAGIFTKTTKVPFDFLFMTTNCIIDKSRCTTRACIKYTPSFLFMNCETRNLTTRNFLFPGCKPFTKKQFLKKKKKNQCGNANLKTHLNIALNGKEREVLCIPLYLQDFFNSVPGITMSPDVAKTSSAQNNNPRIIYKNIKKKLTLPCNLEEISQYFKSDDDDCSTMEMRPVPEECETVPICSTTVPEECRTVTTCPTIPDECVTNTSLSSTTVRKSSTSSTTSTQPATKITTSTNKQTTAITSTIKTTSTKEQSTKTPKITSTSQKSTAEITTTNQPSTAITTTNQPSTAITTTNKPSTAITTTNKSSTEITTTKKPSTEITTTNQPSTEISNNKSTALSSTVTNTQKTAMNISEETSGRSSTTNGTTIQQSMTIGEANPGELPSSKGTICVPSTCPTEMTGNTSTTTVCVPVTCPDGSSTQRKNTTERNRNFSPLVDVLITFPVFMDQVTKGKKHGLFRKIKHNNIVVHLRNLISTMKTHRYNGIQAENVIVTNTDVSSKPKSFLSNARKKQHSDGKVKSPKKPLEIFILDPNLALWRQGLKSVIHRTE